MEREFVREMEREAGRIAERFENGAYGIKPWYSSVRLFDKKTQRVFIGSHPAGGLESTRLDREQRYSERVHGELGYNSWLDEVWEGEAVPGGSTHQSRTIRAFRAMYGSEDWERVLRSTPCFNAVPFRVPDMDDLPRRLWNDAAVWFQQVMEHLEPRLIICNGNGSGHNSRSPWGAIEKLYKIRANKPISVQGRAASLKIGTVMSGALAESHIVGLPSLARFGPSQLFAELERARPFE